MEENGLQCIYEVLKRNENIGDKIKISDTKDSIEIEFNEYLWIHGSGDIMYLNNDLNHYHFDDVDFEDFGQWLTDIANGDIVFIEDKSRFSLKMLKGIILLPWNLQTISKQKYEKNKQKYLSKKNLRIYTGNAIIKREGEKTELRPQP